MNRLLLILFPFTYSLTSRFDRWSYVIYHCLLEWIPAIVLAGYYVGLTPGTALAVFLNYLAFISLYEIGYLTNDFLSEKVEADPRGRAKKYEITSLSLSLLIAVRLAAYIAISYYLGNLSQLLNWIFFAALTIIFALHNTFDPSRRLATFVGLSVLRFVGPIYLLLPLDVLRIVLPAVLLNYSFLRMITYGGNKGLIMIEQRKAPTFKLSHYAALIPLNLFMAAIYDSLLPLIFGCGYMLMWGIYWGLSQLKVTASQTEAE